MRGCGEALGGWCSLYLPDCAAGAQDLNNLIPTGAGWTLTSSTAINNSGQIAG